MRWCVVLVLVCVLAGCGSGDSTGGKVFIRSRGEIVTTYELDKDGQVLQSATTERSGAVVTRQYTYDGLKGLVAVSRESSATGTATTFVSNEADPSSRRLAKTTKSVVAADGTSTDVDLEYFYAEDGRLEGMLQTDVNGNVQAKGGTSDE